MCCCKWIPFIVCFYSLIIIADWRNSDGEWRNNDDERRNCSDDLVLYRRLLFFSPRDFLVLSVNFSLFVLKVQFNPYFCRAYSCRKPRQGESKGGYIYIKRRNCTLWFWRVRTWKIQTICQEQSNGDALWGVYTLHPEHFS